VNVRRLAAALALALATAVVPAAPAFAAPEYVGATVPAGFGPGLQPSAWDPEWVVSEDTAWTLELRQGTADGAVVRTLTGTSADGAIRPVWDGTDANGAALPHGFYAWSLTSDAGTLTGRTFQSLVAPPKPTITAPKLVSDVSPRDIFTVSWDGAPEGHHYVYDGLYSTIETTDEARTYFNRGPGTKRFTVYVKDPAGRVSPPATTLVVTPYDDKYGNQVPDGSWTAVHDGRHWKGINSRSTRAGARLSFRIGGDGVWVIGPKAPNYGRYRVTVDGRSWVYDAYSPTVKFRQVLFKLGGLDVSKTHRVVIEVLATPGRTRVGVDGIAGRVPTVS
jgi:hypothetical protein